VVRVMALRQAVAGKVGSLGLRLRSKRPERHVTVGAKAAASATRYLCVAAHLDEGFANWVLRATLEERHRTVGPAYGVELGPVIRHCLLARNRRVVRDGILTALIAGAVWVLGVVAFIPLVTFLMFEMYRRVAIWLRRRLSTLSVVTLLWNLGWLFFWALQLVSFAGLSFLTVREGRTIETLPIPAEVLLGVYPYLLLSVVVGEALHARRVLGRDLRAGSFDPTRAPSQDAWVEERLGEVAREAENANVTIYSGFSPFLGAGEAVQSWSFVIDLTRGRPDPLALGDDRPARVRPVNVEQVYAAVERRVLDLQDADPNGRARLAGLRAEHRVFVDGRAIRHDDRFLPNPVGRPRVMIGDDEVRRAMLDATGAVRHYLSFQVGSWENEVVRSAFLHLAMTGHMLYVELVVTLLQPIAKSYHVVDVLSHRLAATDLLRVVGNALWRAPVLVLAAPWRLIGAFSAPLRRSLHERAFRQSIEDDLDFDYGAAASIREAAQDDGYHNYFQSLDAERQRKVLELRILDALVDVLDEHGVDTSLLRSRQTTILNQGVIMAGEATVANSTIVAGPHTQVSVSNLSPAMASLAPAPGPPAAEPATSIKE
jgi:hypothetical protein